MASIALDQDYSATFRPFREGRGYVAKGTVFFRGKPMKDFAAHGDTITKAEQIAWAMAQEIYDQMRLAKAKRKPRGPKRKKREPGKRQA